MTHYINIPIIEFSCNSEFCIRNKWLYGFAVMEGMWMGNIGLYCDWWECDEEKWCKNNLKINKKKRKTFFPSDNVFKKFHLFIFRIFFSSSHPNNSFDITLFLNTSKVIFRVYIYVCVCVFSVCVNECFFI